MAKRDDVAKAQTTEISAATANFYEKYGQAAAGRNFVGSLLKFNKFGEFVAGQYDDKIAIGTRLAAYMDSLATGYTRWEANRPVETIMGPVGAGFVPPKRAELGYLDKTQWERFDDGREKDPWAFTNTLVLIHRRKDGDEWFTFTTSSRGGIVALGQLSRAHGSHVRQRPDEYPIVELGMGSYQHPDRSIGEVRFPIFKIADWILVKDLPPIESGDPTPIAADNANATARGF
jgi:hypothetical protein